MKIRENQRIGPSDIEKVYKTPETKRLSNQLPVAESVRVSPEARTMAAAVREPEVPDEKKIAQLKEAIRNGTFKVDVGRIADAILTEEA
jgi:flagellar biosynthesis anti-sigma factor FlgM